MEILNLSMEKSNERTQLVIVIPVRWPKSQQHLFSTLSCDTHIPAETSVIFTVNERTGGNSGNLDFENVGT